jgi:phospholipid transport system substrate-binding protein
MKDVLHHRFLMRGRALARLTQFVILALFVAAFGSGKLQAQQSAPRDVVSDFQETLLATMKDAQTLGFDGRYQRLQSALNSAFDLKEMTRIVVGTRWVKLSELERTQVVDLFRRFSVSTYASEFSSYGGEQFEIGAERAQPNLGTIVETRILRTDDAPIELDYLLRETPNGWKIVDVYLAGAISELARRRDEFGSIIRNQGFGDLLALLKKKNKEMAGS